MKALVYNRDFENNYKLVDRASLKTFYSIYSRFE